jgi:hypothetical protein
MGRNVGRESLVKLEIGAQHSQVRLARLVAAGVATLEGFDVEAVEDFRISVDEGCVWLIDQGNGGPLMLQFSVGPDGGVEVTGETARGQSKTGGTLSELAAQILAASCAEHRFDADDAVVRFVLKTRPSSLGDGLPPGDESRS